MKLRQAQIIEREETGEHALLRYRWTGPSPEPGQFVMVRPAGPDPPLLGSFLSRPFFVHDFTEDAISLLFKVRGPFTETLAEVEGKLFVSAPRGRGFSLTGTGPVALVGGGVWVAPLKLLGRRLEESGVHHETYLEMPRGAPQGYAEWLAGAYPGAQLAVPDGGTGSVEAVLGNLGSAGGYTEVCVSGSAGDLAAAKRVLAGRVPAQLAVRERMACATGACYGCVVPVWEAGEQVYARACVEGPVFPAEKLAW